MLSKVSVDEVLCITVKPVFFRCPLFCEFREPGKFAQNNGPRKFEYNSISV